MLTLLQVIATVLLYCTNCKPCPVSNHPYCFPTSMRRFLRQTYWLFSFSLHSIISPFSHSSTHILNPTLILIECIHDSRLLLVAIFERAWIFFAFYSLFIGLAYADFCFFNFHLYSIRLSFLPNVSEFRIWYRVVDTYSINIPHVCLGGFYIVLRTVNNHRLLVIIRNGLQTKSKLYFALLTRAFFQAHILSKTRNAQCDGDKLDISNLPL